MMKRTVMGRAVASCLFVLPALGLSGCAHATETTSSSSAPRRGLSRRPQMPADIDADAVRASYPQTARERLLSGFAKVRITVSAEGTLSALELREESPVGAGFGDACMALLRSHAGGWQPALDQDGQPVPHAFTFSCQFDVQPSERAPAQ